MSEALSIEEARQCGGLRLVLPLGIPSPWSEAAKGILRLKRISYTPVAHDGRDTTALLEWTDQASVPALVDEDERAYSRWDEILFFAEEREPEPQLIPSDVVDRALLFGLAHELGGRLGLAWCRRLTMVDDSLRDGRPLPKEVAERIGPKYGYGPAAAAQAPGRVLDIVGLLATQLAQQKLRGRTFLIGEQLSALDVYWATFAALIDPLPDELYPTSAMIREAYTVQDPKVLELFETDLRSHRDFIYSRFLPGETV